MNTLSWLRRHRVAVLKGGWSRERPISLKTGAAVEAALKRLGVRPVSIDVKRDVAQTLARKRPQFAFIALHGAFGESGGIQSLLEALEIPYTGSGPIASAVAMDKHISKQLFVRSDVPTPRWSTLRKGESIDFVKKRLRKNPLFVKPVDQGSAIGASRVKTAADLSRALRACFKVSSTAMIEDFVAGRELTVGILGDRTLPVVEIIPVHAFYDFHSKYAAGGSRHVVPALIPYRAQLEARNLSLAAFRALGCSVYGRVDLLLDKRGRLSVLEVNTIPGMTATSLLPDAAKAAGIGFDELVLRIADLSLRERGVRK